MKPRREEKKKKKKESEGKHVHKTKNKTHAQHLRQGPRRGNETWSASSAPQNRLVPVMNTADSLQSDASLRARQKRNCSNQLNKAQRQDTYNADKDRIESVITLDQNQIPGPPQDAIYIKQEVDASDDFSDLSSVRKQWKHRWSCQWLNHVNLLSDLTALWARAASSPKNGTGNVILLNFLLNFLCIRIASRSAMWSGR